MSTESFLLLDMVDKEGLEGAPGLLEVKLPCLGL